MRHSTIGRNKNRRT